MQLSPHFSLAELTRTGTGLPNEPDDAAPDAMYTTPVFPTELVPV